MIAAQLSTIKTQLIETVFRPEFTMRRAGETIIDLKSTIIRSCLNLRKKKSSIKKDCCTIEHN